MARVSAGPGATGGDSGKQDKGLDIPWGHLGGEESSMGSWSGVRGEGGSQRGPGFQEEPTLLGTVSIFTLLL